MGAIKTSRRIGSASGGKTTARKTVAKKSALRSQTAADKRIVAIAKAKPKSKSGLKLANKVAARKPKTTATSASRLKSAVKARPKAVLDVRRKTPLKNGSRVQAKTRLRHEKFTTVDRKINSLAALVFVAVLSGLIGTLIFLGSKKEQQLVDNLNLQASAIENAAVKTQAANMDKVEEDKNSPKDGQSVEQLCLKRKFEGEAKIHGWRAEKQAAGSEEILVNVAGDDLAELPVATSTLGDGNEDFTIRLIDASRELATNLEKASRENPYEFTIKGFMYACDNTYFSSVESVTKALEKS